MRTFSEDVVPLGALLIILLTRHQECEAGGRGGGSFVGVGIACGGEAVAVTEATLTCRVPCDPLNAENTLRSFSVLHRP